MRILSRLSGPVWIDDGDPNIPGHAKLEDIAGVAGISIERVRSYAERAGLGNILPSQYLSQAEVDKILKVVFTTLGEKAVTGPRVKKQLRDIRRHFSPRGRRRRARCA
jgi:hypothetical protein